MTGAGFVPERETGSCLIADIGGTNTRCALAGGDGPEQPRSFRNAEYPDLDSLLADYLAGVPGNYRPNRGVLAVAAPVRGELVHMTNLDWTISAGSLRARLGLRDLELLNDFEALAYALPTLPVSACLQIGAGAARNDAPKVVIGPGTGLGVAGLVPVADGWQAIPGEGGHASMAASDELEERLVRQARERYGHCSIERLVSGSGLALIHECLHGPPPREPAAVGALIEAGDADACRSFEVFCGLLATAAADVALLFGAFGGVYIGGGIAPRFADRLADSTFRRRFENKGRYSDYLRSIPTYLITERNPTLAGLCAYSANRARTSS